MPAVQLRPYQAQLIIDIRACWAAGGTPLAVLPTGGGKTVVFSRIIAEHQGPAVAIAHRRELVAQISRSLAIEGIRHRIIAPMSVVRAIAAANSSQLGHSFLDPNAPVGVAGVDSIAGASKRWTDSITLVVQDEAHHHVQGNKWGKTIDRFKGARLLGVTATPERADGKGLGATADGYFTDIVLGPSMRELIDAGHLNEYRPCMPASAHIDLANVTVSKSTGDYSGPKLRAAMKAASITGDVVATYKRLAAGKLGITFVTDVEAALEMAKAYREAGVPAAAISAKTPPKERTDAIKRFAVRDLHVLVNVDLFGEGFDLSSAAGRDVCVETISMVRPTHSYVLFAQQFGRALRRGPEKAIIIDHVGNIVRHGGPPDFPRVWNLAGRDRRCGGKADDVPKVRVCDACTGPYARELAACPYCGHVWVPAGRGSPRQVDGDLLELDPAVLADMRKAAEKAIQSDDTAQAHYSGLHIPPVAVAANVKRARATREAQLKLRHEIGVWAGVKRAAGATDSEIYRKFYLDHGIDILSACALREREARALLDKLRGEQP